MPEKNTKFLPEKKKNHPEKKFENVPEKTSKCPRIFFFKVGEKTISAREKNPKKYQKPFSRALFIFSGKKKTLEESEKAYIIRFYIFKLKINITKQI